MANDYIVHKAVNLDKVKAKRRAVLSEPGYLEREFIAQAKYDGCNCIIVIEEHDDNWSARAYSRTGEDVKSMDHVLAALSQLPDIQPGAYLGEAWCPDASFAEISGWFRRQTPDEETCRLQFALFDYLTIEEWVAGRSDYGYVWRTNRLPELLGQIPQGRAPLWLAQTFGKIAERWPGDTVQTFCNKLVDVGGYDGLILRDPLGPWVKGRGTDGEIIKIKRVLSFDLEVIGWEMGKGKHAKRAGALIVSYGGKELRVGTGLTDQQREWIAATPMEYIGLLAEVEAMDYSEDGLLREPRFKGFRFDKLEADA